MAARSPRLRLVALAAAAGWVTLHRLGETYGSTRDERRAGMPGDDVVRRPQVVATHATTIPVPPDQVWPWLMQVGWHRGGWYTPRWVDAVMFPDNAPSADRILGRPDLTVGDFVPDGSPATACGFVVRSVATDEHLVLESTTHLPLSWRQRGSAGLHWTWCFTLRPVAEGRATRLVFRWRARTRPLWLTLGAHVAIVPADFVMSRGMMRGLAQRAGNRAAEKAALEKLGT